MTAAQRCIHAPTLEPDRVLCIEVAWLAETVAPVLLATGDPYLVELARWLQHRDADWLIPEMAVAKKGEYRWAAGFARMELMMEALCQFMVCGPGEEFSEDSRLCDLLMAIVYGIYLEKPPVIGGAA